MLQCIWQFLGDNASNLIATSALGLTIWQAAIQRKHNRLSTLPHLTDFVVADFDLENKKAVIVLFIENNGLGSAFINSFDVTVKGEKMDFEEALRTVLHGEICTYQKTTFAPGYAIKQGDKIELLRIEIPNGNQEDLARINSKTINADIKIKYKSIYGETKEYSTIDSPREIL